MSGNIRKGHKCSCTWKTADHPQNPAPCKNAINGLFEDLKARRPDTVIESAKIKEDIKLPSPIGRIVINNKLDTLPERIAEEIIGCFGNYLSFAAYSKLNATYTG